MKLAINGGKPVRNKPFPAYRTIGQEEKAAVIEVLDSGILSKYLGTRHDNFYGGPQVRALENEWADYFGVKHAIAVNSCTSGLYCAVGAIGIEPGEEIIVSPYTMSASATAPLIFNGIPKFADIEPDYFCLSPDSVKREITSNTKGIIVVDLFGQPYDANSINEIANKYGLYVIEDAAQAPGAQFAGRPAGTLGHIGVYSLNYHKHIHCGEGGIVVTNDNILAEKIRRIRNHAEAVMETNDNSELVNMIGFNFRMTEIEAAITRCQLKKLEKLNTQRIKNCKYIEKLLTEIKPIEVPIIREKSVHVYYVHPLKWNKESCDLHRDRFVEAVKAELAPTLMREDEGIKINAGYVRPLYYQPIFQNKIAYGKHGFPFTLSKENRNSFSISSSCPITEDLYHNKLFLHELMHSFMSEGDLDDVANAFYKVYENLDELR